VIRGGELVPVRGSTVMHAGDEILALVDPERTRDLAPVFTGGRGRRDPGATPA
jgi:hypothetical protein